MFDQLASDVVPGALPDIGRSTGITQSAFVEAVDLEVDDQVQTADGGTATITDVRAYHQ